MWKKPLLIISAERPLPWRKRLRRGETTFPVEFWPALQETFIFEAIKKGWATGAAEVAVSFTPDADRPYFQGLTDGRIPLIHQRGSHPRHWIPNTMDDGQLLGFEPVVLLRAYTPALPMAELRDALIMLAEKKTDAILGTGENGLYLIGLQISKPSFFRGLHSEGPGFANGLLAHMEKAELEVTTLPEVPIIEDPVSAGALLESVRAEPASWRKRAPVTTRFLERQGLVTIPPESPEEGER